MRWRMGMVALLAIAVLDACGGGGGAPPPVYTIGGTVSGLAPGASIVLQDSGGDAVTVASNSRFTFPTAIAAGGAYAVSIGQQPAYQGCAVSAGTGQVAQADVTNIQVHCPLLTTLTSFGLGTDGSYPQSGLVVGIDGNFYGTTEYGGSANYGTVYRLTPTGTEAVIANFAEATTPSRPIAPPLPAADGGFYGTSYTGGANGKGTVFRLASDGTVTILWSFGAGLDGQQPVGALVQAGDGIFYGATQSGGAFGLGTVFSLTPAGTETVLWNFGNGSDGSDPEGGLVIDGDGALYGTTSQGGANSRGTVFRIDPSGVETVLWNFDYTDGSEPTAPLLLANDGNFYGTTRGGGTSGGGTLYRISSAGALTVVWNFGARLDGTGPDSGVIQGRDGNFYGTTTLGGTILTCGSPSTPYGCGTLFRITPAGEETVLWDFGFNGNGASSNPLALVQGADGNFYGVTSGGGTVADGTLYRLTP